MNIETIVKILAQITIPHKCLSGITKKCRKAK
jgi:hypothetical protein